MPEWFKGADLRSAGESLAGSNPAVHIDYFNILIFLNCMKLSIVIILLVLVLVVYNYCYSIKETYNNFTHDPDKETIIIQTSPPNTASTLLVNLIYGYMSPNECVIFVKDAKRNNLTNNTIIKTHNIDIQEITEFYKNKNVYFVVSERGGHKIDKKYNLRKNVLIFQYEELNVTPKNTESDIVDTVYNKLNKFLPRDLTQGDESVTKNDMKNRMLKMNNRIHELRDVSFKYVDPCYKVHGGHRNGKLKF